MKNKILFLAVLVCSVFTGGCATLFPPNINYSNTALLYSDHLKGEPDIYNGQAVFAVYLAGNPAHQTTLGGSYQTSIFLVNADGSNQRRLTFGICEDSPFWTKDGDIVYHGGTDCIHRAWYLLGMKDGQVVSKTEISKRIAQALMDKTMSGQEARQIKWK